MIEAELRGEYDASRRKDALVVADAETGQRIALFLSDRRKSDVVSVSVDLPNCSGSRCYSIPFAWLLDHLRTLEPSHAP